MRMRRLAQNLTGLTCMLLLCACAAQEGGTSGASALDRARAEATALIEAAQSTAVVLQARALATALIVQAGGPERAPAGTPLARAPSGPATGAPLSGTADRPAATSTPGPATAAPAADEVEVVRVGYAVEGALIDIQFRAPKEVSEGWWQGTVYVIDEATGESYREIPVVPKVGPLMSKPVTAGQVGYIMLVNGPVPLVPGSVVTVVLGEYRFEHVPVQ